VQSFLYYAKVELVWFAFRPLENVLNAAIFAVFLPQSHFDVTGHVDQHHQHIGILGNTDCVI
jgi:hypothetical protein